MKNENKAPPLFIFLFTLKAAWISEMTNKVKIERNPFFRLWNPHHPINIRMEFRKMTNKVSKLVFFQALRHNDINIIHRSRYSSKIPTIITILNIIIVVVIIVMFDVMIILIVVMVTIIAIIVIVVTIIVVLFVVIMQQQIITMIMCRNTRNIKQLQY